MSIEYRFILKLSKVEDGRQIELRRILHANNRGTGSDKWRAVMEEAQSGETPVVYRTNNKREAERMKMAITTHGGTAQIVDLTA